MKSGRWLASAAAACVVLAACQASTRPPDLGDCMGDDSGCSPPVVGGGSSGGGNESGADTACGSSSGESQCDQCANASCCGPLSACDESTVCQNLFRCESGCTSSACVTRCQQQFPSGVGALDSLESCLSLKCAVCSESGVGDPCSPGYFPCVSGLTCNGSWCTKACSRSSDCGGLGSNGGNALGFSNACVHTGSGDVCVPGCTANADCAAFASTYCLSTTSYDGLSVSVCTALPDAASD